MINTAWRNPDHKTPFINSLLAEGVTIERNYVYKYEYALDPPLTTFGSVCSSSKPHALADCHPSKCAYHHC